MIDHKCKHIWAHESWVKSNRVGDENPARYPKGLYQKKDAVRCDDKCELMTFNQWQNITI